eukprot:UN01219
MAKIFNDPAVTFKANLRGILIGLVIAAAIVQTYANKDYDSVHKDPYKYFGWIVGSCITAAILQGIAALFSVLRVIPKGLFSSLNSSLILQQLHYSSLLVLEL